MENLKDKHLDTIFERHKDTEITFNKEVAKATGLIQKQLFVKYGPIQKPCCLHSASLMKAKIIVQLEADDLEIINETDSVVLGYSFLGLRINPIPTSFLVQYRVSGLNPILRINGDRYLVSLESPIKPPDDLIRFLGDFIEASANAVKRRETRFPIDSTSAGLIGLKSAKSSITIDNQKVACVILDVSFSGAKVLVPDFAQTVPHNAVLTLDLQDPDEFLEMPGSILRYDDEGREGAVILGIHFEEKSVPLEYKLRINKLVKFVKPPEKNGKRLLERRQEKQNMRDAIEGMIGALQNQKLWAPGTETIKRVLRDLNTLK
ncbi:MAG TPA: PilZ domain-containing protein, partial [Spirochaetia bacterium]|nr:PilZ domain-containing protein [Spirochaetia bacterium]